MDMDDMAILRPHITKVGNRHYRKLAFEGNQFYETSDNADAGTYGYDEHYEDEPECAMVEETAHGFRTSLDVASELIKFICGRKMETKLRIEKETSTQIRLPKPGMEAPVVVTGSRKKDVLSCRHKIELIMESSRQKIPPTHFLSFPLFNKEIMNHLEEFKSTALGTCRQSKGLDASIFQKPPKLHLTIVMLTLLTQEEVEVAASVLDECYEEVIRPTTGEEPIKILLKGVEYMNDDPSKVDVLYAKVNEVDGSGRLQKLANAIMNCFTMKGLAKEEYDKVKLHATVINTKWRETEQPESSSSSQSSRNNRRPAFISRTSFDAREITEMFKNFVFGEHHVDCIHVSQRGAYDLNGQYHCCKSLPLP